MKADSLWIHATDQHPNAVAHRVAARRIATLLLHPRAPEPAEQESGEGS